MNLLLTLLAHGTTPSPGSKGGIPNPAPIVPPGVDHAVGLVFSYGKWLAYTVCGLAAIVAGARFAVLALLLAGSSPSSCRSPPPGSSATRWLGAFQPSQGAVRVPCVKPGHAPDPTND